MKIYFHANKNNFGFTFINFLACIAQIKANHTSKGKKRSMVGRSAPSTKVAPSATDKMRIIDERMKELKASGVTLADVKAYVDERMAATTFRKRRISSGLEITVRERSDDGEGAFFDRYEQHTRDMGAYFHRSIKDGKPVFRYKPAENLYMIIKPVVEEVKIHDGPTLSDALLKYDTYFKFYSLCLGVAILFVFSYLFSPIVWMDITGTDVNFFNQTNATSGLSSRLKSFSSASFMIFVVSGSVNLTNYLLMINPSMRRLQWDTMKWRIMATLGLNVAYTIASGTMFPNVMHQTVPLFSNGCISICVYYDSILAHFKLRLTPERFAEQLGGSGKKGLLTTILAICGIFFILQDMFRHYVVAFVTDNASIVSLNVRNPLNGNMFEITNRQLMDATYFTCTLFFAQSFYSMITSSQLKTASNTKFLMTSK